jgi:hypothetical protein
MSVETILKIQKTQDTATFIFLLSLVTFLLIMLIIVFNKEINISNQRLEICKSIYGQDYTEVRGTECYDPVRMQSKEIPKN